MHLPRPGISGLSHKPPLELFLQHDIPALDIRSDVIVPKRIEGRGSRYANDTVAVARHRQRRKPGAERAPRLAGINARHGIGNLVRIDLQHLLGDKEGVPTDPVPSPNDESLAWPVSDTQARSKKPLTEMGPTIAGNGAFTAKGYRVVHAVVSLGAARRHGVVVPAKAIGEGELAAGLPLVLHI